MKTAQAPTMQDRSNQVTLPIEKTGPRWGAFVINLKQAVDRWAFLEPQLHDAAIEFTRVEAVDGKLLTFPMREVSELSYKLLHGRYLSRPEVGCYLSHLKAIRLFLDTDLDYCLILEDDAALSPRLKAVVNSAIKYGDDWDILRLSTVNSGKRFSVVRTDDCRLGVCFTREKGAGAYVLNRRAASVFLKRLLPMRLAYDIAFDLEYLMGLKALGADPLPVVQTTGFDTQIQTTIRKLPAWRYLTVFPVRMLLEISRVVCRLSLYLRLRFKHLRR
jgi:glycosyl transferase family 25